MHCSSEVERSETKLWMMPHAIRTIAHDASPGQVASMVERLLADAKPTHTAEIERLRSAIVEVLLAEAGPNADASDAQRIRMLSDALWPSDTDAMPDTGGSEAAALLCIQSACEAIVQELDSIALIAGAEPNGSKHEPSEDESEAEDRIIGSRAQPARLDPSRTASAPSAHAAGKRKAIELDSDSEGVDDMPLSQLRRRLRRCSRALVEDERTSKQGEGSNASFEQGDSSSLDGFVVPDGEASASNYETSEAEACDTDDDERDEHLAACAVPIDTQNVVADVVEQRKQHARLERALQRRRRSA